MNKMFLTEYNIESLNKAIYSIVSWFPNRRFLGIVDNLNRDLIKYEGEILGTKQIDTFAEFIEFYQKVLDYYIPKHLKEDFPVDIGNVRSYSNNRFYKVFIGNGSEDTYETLFIIESLINDFEQYKDIWYEIICYEDMLLSSIECFKNDFTQDEFECPPEAYFNFINDNFEKFHNQYLADYFKKFISENAELYNFFTPLYNLPIFLPLMKECFLEIIESKIEKVKFEESVWLSFWRRLHCNFTNFHERDANSFYSLKLIHKGSNEEKIFENTLAFICENQLIILEQNNNKLTDDIKKDINDNQYKIAGLCQDGKPRCIEFKEKCSAIFFAVKDNGVSPNINKQTFLGNDDEHVINASSLIGIINNSDSIKEIVDFFIFYNSNQDRIMSFAPFDSVFCTWKYSDQQINEGATEIILAFFPYESVHFNMDLFNNLELYYPFEIGSQFYNIHGWKIVDNKQLNLSLVSKAHLGSVYILSDGNKTIIYQELHFITEDIEIHDFALFKSYSEIVLNGLIQNKDFILSNYENKFLEINIVSKSILEKKSTSIFPIQELEYCRSFVFNENFKHQISLNAPIWDKMFNDNITKKTLEFENTIILNLLEGFNFKDKAFLSESIQSSNNEKRTSSVFEIELNYFIQPLLEFSIPEVHSFKSVRKHISEIIKKLEMNSGIYREEDIVGIVRRFRNEIREGLVSKIITYNQDVLNVKLQNVLSSILFNIDIQMKRLTVFSEEDNLQIDKLQTFREKAIDLREESRVYKPILEYLIEENNIIERSEYSVVPNDDMVNELIAYGKYILDFQNLSDAYYYGASDWFLLEIEDNYLINITETERYLKFVDRIKKAKYSYGDYIIRNKNVDHEMFKKIKISFLQDTKIDFDAFICFLSIFSSNGDIKKMENLNLLNIRGNLVTGKILDFAKYFVDNSKYTIEIFFNILKFLELEKSKIMGNGIIPIWEKKKRVNKFSSKPLIIKSEYITYSPIILDRVKKDWAEGIMNFCLPYDTGMANTLNIVHQWKNNYEKEIVCNLKELFNNDNYVTYMDQELYKLDHIVKHPRDLGDYDLIVIDNQQKEILLFEVKFMRLSQTMKDSMGDQNEYFLNKKAKALKYKKRVEYFENNLEVICKNLGLNQIYKLRSYFLTNKIIKSNFVDYPFEIISFNEFKDLLITNK